MGMKRLIGVTLPTILLFSGCSVDKITIKTGSEPKQESKVEESNKEDKVKPVDIGNYSAEDYIISISDIDLEMGNKVTEMDNLLVGEDLPLRSKAKYIKLAEEIIDLTVQIRELKVPKEFEEVHKDVDKAMQLYSTGFQHRIDYVKKPNLKNSDKALEVITEAGNLWEKTTERLGEEYTKIAVK